MHRSSRFVPVRHDDAIDPAVAIAARLRRIGGPDASAVRVHLDGETVRLSGRVPQWHLKQLATSAVLAENGSYGVCNELMVTN